MIFEISEKVIRVLKAITEPRIAIKDVVKEPAHKSPIFRGKHEIKYELCIGCDACNKICPVDAIKMKPLPLKKPRIVPEVNLAICIFCGLCEDVCPTKPKAIKLSGGDIEMITDGTPEALDSFWVRVDIPQEWIEAKKKEEEEKARKKKEAMAKKKAQAAKKAAEAKKTEEIQPKTDESKSAEVKPKTDSKSNKEVAKVQKEEESK
ncbi:MAG: 4Fe-4S binding protein [Nautiliaceae bacterium]